MMTKAEALTIQQAIERCLEETARSAQTLRAYQNALKKFIEYLGCAPDTPLVELSAKEFIRFPNWLQKQKFSKSTFGVYRSGVSHFMNWLITNDYLEITQDQMVKFANACQELSKQHQTKLPDVASVEDTDKIVEAARNQDIHSPIKERDLAIVLFMRSSGIRVGELVQLKVQDIDFASLKARVIGKGDKEAFVRLNQEASDALNEYWHARGFYAQDDPAFARHDKKSAWRTNHQHLDTQAVRNMIKRLREKAGVEGYHPHQLRHDFGTNVLRSTQNLEVTRRMMRHSSTNTTSRYMDLTENELDATYAQVFAKEN